MTSLLERVRLSIIVFSRLLHSVYFVASLRNFERHFRAVCRVRTNPDLGARGFNGIFVLIVPKRKGIRPQTKTDVLCLSCSQLHMLEALESANGLRGARALQANVELNGLLARACTGVGDVGADGKLGSR